MVTLGGLQLSFHCSKWHRCVGDDRWALDWIWRFHHRRRFNLPFQELLSSHSISSQSWRTGLLLLLWQRCCLLGVQGEGEGGANSDGERESFALASQSLAESQALGCQRPVIFRSIGCRHFLQNIWTNKTSGARDTCCLFNSNSNFNPIPGQSKWWKSRAFRCDVLDTPQAYISRKKFLHKIGPWKFRANGHFGPNGAHLGPPGAQERPDTRSKCVVTMCPAKAGQSGAVGTKSVPLDTPRISRAPKRVFRGPNKNFLLVFSSWVVPYGL